MKSYRYRAKVSGGDKVFGEIRAQNSSEATDKLYHLGFTDIHLEEQGDIVNISEERNQEKLYTFEGYKQDGALIQGTLSGADRLSVLRELLHQYFIIPVFICEADASEAEKLHMRQSGMEELASQLREDERVLLSREKVLETVLSDVEKDFFREIDYVVQEATDFIARNKDKLSVSDFDLLQTKVRELLRVKGMRDFAALTRLKQSINGILYFLQKKLGEIVDRDLKVFFSALKEYSDLIEYAKLVRGMPNLRRKLFFFELRRLFGRNDRPDALKKVLVILRHGVSGSGGHRAVWYELQRFLGALTLFYLLLFAFSHYFAGEGGVYWLRSLQGVSRNVFLVKLCAGIFLLYALLTFKLYIFRPGKVIGVFLLALALVGVVTLSLS